MSGYKYLSKARVTRFQQNSMNIKSVSRSRASKTKPCRWNCSNPLVSKE